jgi:hypothetical protein
MGARPETAYIAHECTGRIRLKVPARRGDAGFFQSLAARVASTAGVVGVEANAATGSILILHALEGTGAWDTFAASGGLALASGPFRTRAVVGDVRRLATGLDREVTSITGGELDLWSASFIALFALGVNELRKGNVAAPAWYTAFWYAFNVLLKSPEGDRTQRV